MKILVISLQSPEISVGGIERYISNFIDFAKKSSDETIFLLPKSVKKKYEKINNISIYRQGFLKIRYEKRFGRKGILQKELEKKSREFFSFLTNLLQKEKIDIIDVQNFHLAPPAFNLVLNMVCFTHNIPLVLRVHSYASGEIQKIMMNSLFWKKIICVSKSVAGDCFSKGISIRKLTTKYLGVNTKIFNPSLDNLWLKRRLGLPKTSKIILHASRVINGEKEILKEKGVITLIEAFSKLNHKDKEVKLLVAMAAPPSELREEFRAAREKLKGYIKLHNLEERIIYQEFKLEEMPLVYVGSDLFVLASENETLGQVYIEAMACGLPVIGTNVGGIPEIIVDNCNGFLVLPNDSSSLAQKIDELLYNEKLRKKFIVAGLKTVATEFSNKKQFASLFRYFRKLPGQETD